jgi:putative endonuclease
VTAPPRLARRRAAERRGRWAERLAAALLYCKGYRLVATRHRTPLGEIDLVMRRGRLLVFVEVKYRDDATAGIYALGPRQQARLRRAAVLFGAAHPAFAGFDRRFDLVVVARGALPRHIKNAW